MADVTSPVTETVARAWAGVRAALAGQRELLLAGLRQPAVAQRRQLFDILRTNAETEFGRRHGFADIADPHTYQERVPTHTYEALEPHIRRMAAGERGVLCAEPILAFECTSGSTRGEKLIPYTESGLGGFQRAVLPWLDDLLSARPGLAAGRMYWALSPAARRPQRTAGGLPIGMPSDASYFGAALAPLFEALLAVPPVVTQAADVATWRAQTLQALAAATDLTFISVWSPTFLLELLRDLPDAAARWPRLDTISCWTSAGSQRFLPALRGCFPGDAVTVQFQGKGLLATEGAVTLPLWGEPAPVLAVHSGFYEFIDAAGRARLCDELSDGEEYRVLLTTHSGLYRYELQDRVRVCGFVEATPRLEFLGRAGVHSDLCGEKLSEAFVLDCLAALPGFALLTPSLRGRPHYVLFVDAALPVPDAATIEAALGRNPQYDYARRLGQLGPLTVQPVRAPLEKCYAQAARAGRRLGDFKPPVLSDRTDWEQVLLP